MSACLYACMQAVNEDIRARANASRRLYVLETRYNKQMADGILHFVRPLRAAVLSQSGYNTLFQNIEKVLVLIFTSCCKIIRRRLNICL